MVRIGRHLNVGFGFLQTPKLAHDIGCNILQIFLGHPTQVISKARNKSDLEKFGKELEKYSLTAVIHASFTINLCHPVDSKRFKISLRSLVQDLNGAHYIGDTCIGVIIHMGKNIPANNISNEKALENYISGLKQALSLSPEETIIILETGASQGSEVGSRLEELAFIYDGLNSSEKKRVKFCIDTCHIWVTGYDISNNEGVLNFFGQFNKLIGVDKIACIHFNDSRNALHACVDRHADLGFGFIGNNGLKAVSIYAKKHGIPIIMETPLENLDPKTGKEITFAYELSKINQWIK